MSENLPGPDMLYVRFSRDVLLSDSVEEFRAAADYVARDVFGDKNSVLKRTESIRPDPNLSRKGGYSGSAIGIQAARIYPAESWTTTQFELAMTTEDRRKQKFYRFVEASKNIVEKVTMTSDVLGVDCDSIEFQKQPGYGHLGEEIILPVKLEGDGVVLDEQNSLLLRQIRSSGPGNDLTTHLNKPRRAVLQIGRLPKYKPEMAEEYDARKVLMAKQVSEYLPLLGVELGRLKRRTSD